MANVLIYSEKAALVAELATAARSVDDSVAAVVVNNADMASKAAGLGLDVLSIENGDVNLGDTAVVAFALKQAMDHEGAQSMFLASNRRGKELAGRLAQMLGAGCLTDVNTLQVQGGDVVASRNTLGGSTVSDISISTEKKVYAISGKSFMPAEPAGIEGTVSAFAVKATPSVTVLETKQKSVDSVDVTEADALVVVGQGLDDESQVETASKVAEALGGIVGCSKPLATDRGWLSEERIVGISGSLCKPDLAVTLGVSGQVQFSVGVRDAKTIVAIDKDENAPIFQVADYGLVADLADALPALQAELV